MKANEARKLSEENEPIVKKRYQEDYAKRKKEVAVEKRKMIKENHERVIRLLAYCHAAIKETTKQALHTVRISVNDNERVRKIVLRRLKADGYDAKISYDTVFTGVDDWTENYFIEINW